MDLFIVSIHIIIKHNDYNTSIMRFTLLVALLLSLVASLKIIYIYIKTYLHYRYCINFKLIKTVNYPIS